MSEKTEEIFKAYLATYAREKHPVVDREHWVVDRPRTKERFYVTSQSRAYDLFHKINQHNEDVGVYYKAR